MKKIALLLFFAVFTTFAQQLEIERIYATMALHDAEELQNDLPNQVSIIATKGNEAAVYMTENAAHLLHDRVLVHGPGYIFKASKEAVLESLQRTPQGVRSVIDFTITEETSVAAALQVINTQNIEDHILELEAYGTRHHSTSSGAQSAVDLKDKWEAMAAQYGRTDVSVRLFDHTGTNMQSVIMTIEGQVSPEEYVIVGGHLDSTSTQSQTNAPGADDDASGIATITEAVRSLFEINFVSQRTIEVMAYAAEEIGLVGSAEIAQEYSSNNIDVGAVVQFDMTNYNGSANDLSFITDFTDGTLNSFLMDLLDHYNGSGEHEITYSTSLCNYGCSDHASWTSEGYMAAFPFEANFGDHNSAIHTPNDTYPGTATHATKFAKLCAEFLIEAAKSTLIAGIDEATQNSVFISYANGAIAYSIEGNTQFFNQVVVYDMLGKKVANQAIKLANGSIPVSQLNQGLYIVSFVTNGKGSVSKKVILK